MTTPTKPVVTQADKITPEMDAAWVEYEAPELKSASPALRYAVAIKHAFMSGWLAHSPSEPSVVSQDTMTAARLAAANWCSFQPFASKHAEAVSISAGEWDHHSLVQAFASAIEAAQIAARNEALDEAALEARVCWREGVPYPEVDKYIRALRQGNEQ